MVIFRSYVSLVYQRVPFMTIIIDGNYSTWQFLMGKSTISMAVFNSYVKLYIIMTIIGVIEEKKRP